MTQKTETLNVRVPDEIAGWIDSLVEKKLFSSRSEVIRPFLREYVNEQKNKNSQNYQNFQNSNGKKKKKKKYKKYKKVKK